MGFTNLRACVQALEKQNDLVRITQPLSSHLEVGAVQRRVFQAKGPALLFENVKGSPFPMLGNLYGTLERIHFLFQDTMTTLKKIFALKQDASLALKNPLHYGKIPFSLYNALPRTVKTGPVLAHRTSISHLPQLVSWTQDGGSFITLPAVYSEDPEKQGFMNSNLGMYRIQLSGGTYTPEKEVGLHYQIHRGLGIHHAKALEQGKKLPVNIFVGGPPALALAAVMPLPEALPELAFAGVLAGHRMPMIKGQSTLPILAQADFCITGTIAPYEKPEGPFGDHLGYYSLAHDFPVLQVETVYHRPEAIWPFTTVGRPPQEDTMFGAFIHELTAPLVPNVFPGVEQVHAVDAAGVHPLLLAVGKERYTPYAKEKKPEELITSGLSLLGNTQTSLAKYLFITAKEENPYLKACAVPEFFSHILERADFTRDLHFITCTTTDTLDYTGTALNRGSKLLLTVCGPKRRSLAKTLPQNLHLPSGFHSPILFHEGILAITSPPATHSRAAQSRQMPVLIKKLEQQKLTGIALMVCVDNAKQATRGWNDFLWHTFTRSDPALDVHGLFAFTSHKHWGCLGPLIIDARLKPWQAPPLEDDPAVEKKVDTLFAKGGPLAALG